MANAAERVEAFIREQIRTGQLKPGDHIPHVPLARRLGFSNNPIIQALRKLEGHGILERDRGGLARVREFSLPEVCAAVLLRETLEGLAARHCAQQCTDEEMALLEVRCRRLLKLLQGQTERGDLRDTAKDPVEQDAAFHRSIVKFSHLPFLENLHEATMFVTLCYRLDEARWPPFPSATLAEEHERIMRAIRERDGDAAEKSIHRHLGAVRKRYEEACAQDLAALPGAAV